MLFNVSLNTPIVGGLIALKGMLWKKSKNNAITR
jgi:hypothetical protein